MTLLVILALALLDDEGVLDEEGVLEAEGLLDEEGMLEDGGLPDEELVDAEGVGRSVLLGTVVPEVSFVEVW